MSARKARTKRDNRKAFAVEVAGVKMVGEAREQLLARDRQLEQEGMAHLARAGALSEVLGYNDLSKAMEALAPEELAEAEVALQELIDNQAASINGSEGQD